MIHGPRKRDLSVWGIALDRLRHQRGWSQMDLATRGVVVPSVWFRILRSKKGPTVSTLDQLLQGMGFKWHDWALAYEWAVRNQASQGQAREGTKKGII